MNTKKFRTLDRIVLEHEDYENILHWVRTIPEKPMQVDVPFYEGIIIKKPLQTTDNQTNAISLIIQKGIRLYFSLGEDSNIRITELHFDEKDHSHKPFLSFSFNLDKSEMGETFRGELHSEEANRLSHDDRMNRVSACLFMLPKILHYISNYKGELRVTEQTLTRMKKGKSKKGKRGKKRVVKVGVKTYSFPKKDDSVINRLYERQTESWRVRGHWRYYLKTGKRVWIEPHVRGEGKITAKEYRV